MSFYSIFAILLKDLIDVTRSKAVWISLATPVVLSLLFTCAFSYSDSLPGIGYYDNGKSGFFDFLKKTRVFSIKSLKNKEEGPASLNDKDCLLVIILPEHFDEDLLKNSQPAVRILINEPALKGSEILLMELFELMRVYAKQPFPMQVKIEKIYKPGRGGTLQYILPLWILLTIMGSLVITTSSLIEEKDRKTLDALLVSPASIYDFITGKALLGIILSFSSASLLLGLNRSLTGNLPVVFSMLLLGGIFFSFWGVFVAFISPSQSTANSINSLVFICLMVPIVLSENSKLLRRLSGCLPSYYLVDGITKGLEGNCSGLFLNYLVLGGGSILLFALCLNVINRQEN